MDETLAIPGVRPDGCSELRLRRLRAGELHAEARAELLAHLESCARCRAVQSELEGEERAFRREVPFESLAPKVEARKRSLTRLRWAGPVSLALAAGIAALVLAAPLRAVLQEDARETRLKGGAALALFVGGDGQQAREVKDVAALAAGERVRVGYQAGGAGYVLVLSIDEAGEVTPLYPETGESLAAERAAGVHLMPDSLELTGTGLERVVALFSERPIQVAQATAAARRAWEKAGNLEGMGRLEIPAEQVDRLVRKP